MRKVFGLIGLGGRMALPALFAFTAACVLSVSSAQGAVYAGYWTFPNNTTGPLTADAGSTPASVTASIAITTGTASYTQAGTTTGDPAPSPVASYSLHLSDAGAAPVFTINLSGSGLSGLAATYELAFQGFSSSATTRTITWTYSLNGGAYTAFTPAQSDAVTGSGTVPDWGTSYSDYFSVAGFLTATTISFRGTFGAATTGGAYFDNITLTAVPEPINCAMAVFGLVFVGGSVGRFYLGRRRSATVG